MKTPTPTSMTRRGLLRGTLGVAGLTAWLREAPHRGIRSADAADEGRDGDDRWERVRDEFEIDRERIHLAGLLLAPHPRTVREAIERHRAAFDEDPARYVLRHDREERRARTAAAEYLGAKPHEIALTFNTTTGLGLVYGGVVVRDGQRFLTTEHDYAATHSALRYRAKRAGIEIDRVTMYDRPQDADADEMVERVMAGVRDETRVVALTWVHSSSGVKIPVRRIADALAEKNRGRDADARALLCIDGVHGLGVEDVSARELGCDVLIAGTHKWLFGPRGTGIIWARQEVHDALDPIIHTFTEEAGWGGDMSPGGFHAFDHRWALPEAFAFHDKIGKAAIEDRVHDLAGRFKDAIAELRHVTLLTPRDTALSSGIICFQVRGRSPGDVVQRLRAQRILASTTPYTPSYARIAPGLLNSPDEVEPVISALRALG